MNRGQWALAAVAIAVVLAGCSSGTTQTPRPLSSAATPEAALTTVASSLPFASETPAASPSPDARTVAPAASARAASGRLVAYAWKNRIAVLNADGSGTHELLPGAPGFQRPIGWSADGSR